MRRYLIWLMELHLRVIRLLKSSIKNFNYKVSHTKLIPIIASKKGLRNMFWITACLTNIFRNQDNNCCKSFNYTSKPLLYYFTVLIFAFKLPNFQLLTHIPTLFASLIACFLSYILFYPSHTFLFGQKSIFLWPPKQRSFFSCTDKFFSSDKPFVEKTFPTQKIRTIRSLKHQSRFLCTLINQFIPEFFLFHAYMMIAYRRSYSIQTKDLFTILTPRNLSFSLAVAA